MDETRGVEFATMVRVPSEIFILEFPFIYIFVFEYINVLPKMRIRSGMHFYWTWSTM